MARRPGWSCSNRSTNGCPGTTGWTPSAVTCTSCSVTTHGPRDTTRPPRNGPPACPSSVTSSRKPPRSRGDDLDPLGDLAGRAGGVPEDEARCTRPLPVPGQRLHLDASVECGGGERGVVEVFEGDHQVQPGRRA